MNGFTIVTDSCCDMPDALARELNIVVIPMTFTLGGQSYLNYLDWREIAPQAFYQLLRDGKTGVTSAVNPDLFLSTFEPLLRAGEDVLYLGFSSSLSSTYNSGVIAMEELKGKYPDRQILCVDTLCASLGEGLLVYLVAMKQRDGCTLTEAKEYAEKIKLNLCHWFTVDDLAYLKRGGRISASTALLGSVLNIKPILRVDDKGCLVSAGKVRGRKEAIRTLARNIAGTISSGDDRQIFISHGDCESDASDLAKLVRSELGRENILINDIGPVIGTHSGPGTLAIFCLGAHR